MGWPVGLPDAALPLMERAGFRVTGDVAWMPRCPASYISPFTTLMLHWYLWLEQWHRTPLDMGLTDPALLDPRYHAAMVVLKRETMRVEREELERLRAGK